MASHKAAFDAGEVERLVILVVVILGAEVFIPVAGHILLEESYKVFEELEAGDDDFPLLPDAKISKNISQHLIGRDFSYN